MGMVEKEQALQSMIIRVLVPNIDVKKIQRCSEKVGVVVLSTEDFPDDDKSKIVQLLLTSSFSLYALGKMVAYIDLLAREE